MENNTGKETDRNSSTFRKKHSLGQRALALILTFLMVFGSSGTSIYAEDRSESTEQGVIEITETADKEIDTLDEPDDSETDSEDIQESASKTEDETAAIRSSRIKSRLYASEDTQDPINLEDYLTDKTTMQITVWIDGKKYVYTPDELNAKGIEIAKGSPVKVELYFSTIYRVKKGQTLEYQLPENLMDYSGANEYGYVWQDTVWEENNSGADVEAADWVIDNTGKLTVIIRDDFFEGNKHDDDTVDLFGFNIKFSGSFSSERGEHSGNGDNVISFRGETDGSLSFTIPFEYKNEHANALVEKALSSYDAATRTATYEIKVTAPAENTYTATNVVVTDTIQCDDAYIVKVKDNNDKDTKQVYRNYTPSTGTFNNETGVWTIGDMTPGQIETLSYSIVISEDAYKTGAVDRIINVATVTFNDDGSNQAYAPLDLPSVVVEKTANLNENGNLLTTENGETYITYTLTVTAFNQSVSDVNVNDEVTPSDRITKITVPDGGASQGTVDINSDWAFLTWHVGTVDKDHPATLTYRAYLNPDSWQISEDPNNPGTVSLKINNTATLYIGDEESMIPLDTSTIPLEFRKTWLNKGGTLVTDSKDPKYNLMKYSLKVNGDPVSSNVTSIYDKLIGGIYEEGGSIVVTRYTSSDKTQLVDTTEIPLSEVINSTNDYWNIDLVKWKLNGPYYYELVYYVESTAVNVQNSAGIGFGYGTGYGVATTVTGSGGMTYGTDYSKSFNKTEIRTDGENKWLGYSQWTVSVNKTIPQGAVYVDWLSDTYVYTYEQFWFTDESLADIVIQFDGKTLTQGVDYTVKGVWMDRTNSNDTIYKNAYKTDPNKERYYKFEITFKNEYEATSSKKLTISYKIMVNYTPRDENYMTAKYGGIVPLFYNYCRWKLPEYGNLIATGQGANYSHSNYVVDTPLLKGNGTYNETDGTISWNLTVNQNGTIGGDATLEEYLPYGLSFVSAEIFYRRFPVTSGATYLGEITQETYLDEYGRECIKVIIPIKDLAAWAVQSSLYITADNPYGIGTTNVWTRAGEIQIRLVTKIDTGWLLNLSEDTVVTNKAVLTGDDLPTNGVTATGTATIPGTKQVDKSLIGRDIPSYVQYALNINPDGRSLIPGDDDTLEVVDIMGAGMSIATDYTGYFAVYDVTDVSDLLDSNGNVIASKAKTGTDITSSCSFVNIAGQYLNGMTEDEVGNPTYLITIPDGKHVAVLYWATFEGADGDNVNITNRASFVYNVTLQSGSGDETSNIVVASESSSTVFVGPFFYIKKVDQWGNFVPGVTYSLYEVTMDESGKETGRTEVMTKITGSEETIYFGHRNQDGEEVPQLYKNRLYCLVEESAPAGYSINSEPYYFEFKEKGSDVVDHPSGTTLHQFISGGTYSFTNQFEAASYSVSVKKTVNGKNIVGNTKFSFTLKQDSSTTGAVYTNDTYTTLISANGIKTTITGSGEATFDPLYFTQVGTYIFTLTEDDLSTEAVNNGYTKDSNIFTVTIVVDKGTDNELAIKSATFASKDSSKSGGNLSTSVPTFDNALHLTGTVTLHATKEVTNRTKAVQAGEFAFTVSVGGQVIAEKEEDGTTKIGTDGKPVKKLFYTKEGGDIEINIDIDQDDIGTQIYVISEVEGNDSAITYTNERVKAQVTIAEAGNGKVKAESIQYLTDTNEAVFTNEYQASGSITLEATKKLQDKNGKQLSVKAGEFNFTVTENGNVVATGTTLKGGEIKFTEIYYNQYDVGTHNYVISEDIGSEQFVEYSAKSIKATVTVTDNGNGTLTATATYLNNATAIFTNIYTLIVSTGINIDILPYLLILAVAVLFVIVFAIVRRRKSKTNR